MQDKKFNLIKYKRAIIWVSIIIALYGLILGVITPWVAINQAQKFFDKQLDLQLDVEKLRINPFALSVTIERLKISDRAEQTLVGFDHFFLNFQSSSLFRWAWTLRDLQLTGLTVNAERFTEQETTLSRIQKTWSANQPQEATINDQPTSAADSDSALPRFLVRNIDLNIQNIAFVDHVPATTYRGQLGPVSLHINELSSLPDHVGAHEIVITDQKGTKISWQGSIDLTPISSQGKISIQGPYPVMASEYLQDTLPIRIDSGTFIADFEYQLTEDVSGSNEEKFQVGISKINLGIDNLLINERANNAPIFALNKFALQNATLQWPAQTMDIENVVFDKGEIWVTKNANGITNLQRVADAFSQMNKSEASQPAVSGAPQATSQSVGDPQKVSTPAIATEPALDTEIQWRIKNNRVALEEWLIHWSDESIASNSKLDISQLNFSVENFDSVDNSNVTFQYAMSLLDGSIRGQGSLVPVPFGKLDANINIEQLKLSFLQPYIEEFVKVSVESGTFSGNVSVQSKESDFDIASSLEVADLNVVEKSTQTSLLSWRELAVNEIKLNTAKRNLQVNQINLSEPYGEFVIAEDGTTTIDKILIASDPQVDDSKKDVSDSSTSPSPDEAQEYFFKVGSIQIDNGGGYFSDASLPLPFSTKIHNLNGGVSAIDSESKLPANLEMEGQLDEYGLLTVNGSITPFSFLDKSNISLLFKNINIPNFTPYAVKFAGRKVTEGRLDLDLGYSFTGGKVVGNNKLLLKKFQLGESVDQPGAADLPLDLAVALLKDANGAIDLQIPISGDANNPSFSVAAVAGQALSKIIMSAVTSPFKLLAGLVGKDSEDFGQIAFMPGRSDVTPPEKEKLEMLAKAMAERPALAIKYSGIFDDRFDKVIFQAQKFDQKTREYFGEKFESLSLTSSRYVDYLESQYKAAKLTPELKVVKTEFYAGEDKNSLDELAYLSHIKDRLIALENILPAELTALGDARAGAIMSVITGNGVDAGRVIKVPPKLIKAKNKNDLVVEMEVTVGK